MRGCGKTAVRKLVLGLDNALQGRISRAGGRVAAVFQEPRLLSWRSVEENVRLALPDELAGAELFALFDLLGLAGTEKLYPTELSVWRRVALAPAFAVEPALLTLEDETAARLRKLRVQLWSARPTAALMVTRN